MPKKHFGLGVRRSISNELDDNITYCCTECPFFTKHFRTFPYNSIRCCEGCQKINKCLTYLDDERLTKPHECCSFCRFFIYCNPVTWFVHPQDVEDMLIEKAKEINHKEANIKESKGKFLNPEIPRRILDEMVELAHQNILQLLPESILTEINFHERTQDWQDRIQTSPAPDINDVIFDRGYDYEKVDRRIIEAEKLLSAGYYLMRESKNNLKKLGEEYFNSAKEILTQISGHLNLNQGIEFIRKKKKVKLNNLFS